MSLMLRCCDDAMSCKSPTRQCINYLSIQVACCIYLLHIISAEIIYDSYTDKASLVNNSSALLYVLLFAFIANSLLWQNVVIRNNDMIRHEIR